MSTFTNEFLNKARNGEPVHVTIKGETGVLDANYRFKQIVERIVEEGICRCRCTFTYNEEQSEIDVHIKGEDKRISTYEWNSLDDDMKAAGTCSAMYWPGTDLEVLWVPKK